MEQLGKLILALGLALAVLGALVWLLARLGFRGLPGDIIYHTNGTTIYIPIVTCLVISALLSLSYWLWHWLGRG